MKIIVIIPALNEAKNIGKAINDCKHNFPDSDAVVIDDGSTDNTAAIARSHGARVISHPYNLGIGGAVQTGFILAERGQYDTAIQFDGDGQHMAAEIGKLINAVSGGVDIVVGSRFLDISDYKMSLARRLGTRVFSFVISLICREKFTDTTSGFRAYSKRAIKLFSISYPEDYPEVEALILAHKKNLNIKEVPVKMRLRSGGRSSITPWKSVYYMIKVLLAIFIDLLKK